MTGTHGYTCPILPSLWVMDDSYAGLIWVSQQPAALSQSERVHGAEGWKNGLQASPLQPLNT